MKFHLTLFIYFVILLKVSADTNLQDYSASLNPFLDEVKILYEDENFRYRSLIYRGGYEHVTAFIVIQKYSVNHNGQKTPYELMSSVALDEVNYVYNFSVESVEKTSDRFTLVLDAIHSYLYEETNISVDIFENMEYEITSGLIEP